MTHKRPKAFVRRGSFSNLVELLPAGRMNRMFAIAKENEEAMGRLHQAQIKLGHPTDKLVGFVSEEKDHGKDVVKMGIFLIDDMPEVYPVDGIEKVQEHAREHLAAGRFPVICESGRALVLAHYEYVPVDAGPQGTTCPISGEVVS